MIDVDWTIPPILVQIAAVYGIALLIVAVIVEIRALINPHWRNNR